VLRSPRTKVRLHPTFLSYPKRAELSPFSLSTDLIFICFLIGDLSYWPMNGFVSPPHHMNRFGHCPWSYPFPTSNIHHSLPSTPHFIPEDGGRMFLRNVIHLNQEEHYLYLKVLTKRHLPKSVTKIFSLILHRTTEFICTNVVPHNSYCFP
jgi:hypothetical protein